MRTTRLVALIVATFALLGSGLAVASAAVTAVAITSPAVTTVTWQTSFTVTGTTDTPSADLVVRFHPVGAPSTDDTQTPLTSDGAGAWSTSRVLDRDYQVTATTADGGASDTVLFTYAGAPLAVPTIDQDDLTAVPEGDPFTVSGTATPGSTVVVVYDRADTPPGDVVLRPVTTDPSGHWSRPAVLSVDYAVRATTEDGTSSSRTVTFSSAGTTPLTPVVAQPDTVVVPPYGTFTLSGTARPGAVVVVRYHRAGTAPTDFSIARPVTADSSGAWSRSATLDVDYRAYAVAAAGGAPSRQVLFTSKGAPLATPTVTTAATTYVVPGRPFTISGTATPTSTVYVRYHKAGTPSTDYSIVRPVTVDTAGRWARTSVLDVDYLVYASTADPAQRSATVRFTGAPTITSPAVTTVPRGAAYTVRGKAAPGAPVVLHFHRGGTPATDYSILRTVYADSAGDWARGGTLDFDYRVYATMGTGTGRSAEVLFAASVPPPPLPPEIGVSRSSYVSFFDTTVDVGFSRWHDSSRATVDWLPPKPGFRYTSVRVCLTNRGPGSWDAYGFQFTLKTSANAIYEDAFVTVTDGADFGQQNMQPGEQNCGWVTFELPTTADPTTLIYDPGFPGIVPLQWRTP